MRPFALPALALVLLGGQTGALRAQTRCELTFEALCAGERWGLLCSTGGALTQERLNGLMPRLVGFERSGPRVFTPWSPRSSASHAGVCQRPPQTLIMDGASWISIQVPNQIFHRSQLTVPGLGTARVVYRILENRQLAPRLTSSQSTVTQNPWVCAVTFTTFTPSVVIPGIDAEELFRSGALLPGADLVLPSVPPSLSGLRVWVQAVGTFAGGEPYPTRVARIDIL